MDNYPWIIQIEPIIIYPQCYKSGEPQDCYKCELYKKELCASPRGLCARKYHGHRKGCPGYGTAGCSPNIPMFDEYFDLSKPAYAIYNTFDFKSHVEKMRERHPHWTDRQCENMLYWQGTAKKGLREKLKIFNELYQEKGYEATIKPEGMGVNVFETLKNAGVMLEWPPVNVVYKVAMAGGRKKAVDK